MGSESPLRQLAELITASVDAIEGQFGKSNLQYPSLDVPFDPTHPAEGLSMSPQVLQAAKIIVAACGQLTAIVNIPALSLYDAVGGFHLSSCLRVACEGNMVEILREAGPKGLHAKGIAAKNGLDPVKISRVLRMLATHHLFRELSPDVFTNNRLSSMMDTLKPVSEIISNSDEIFKGSAFMTEALLDPVTGHSDVPKHAPMALAFKSSKPSWEWYEEPQNKFRFKRFCAAMEGSSKADPSNAIMQGFDWSKLAPHSVVVDVGGGIGSTTINIARGYSGLQYVVQDRPAVIEQAIEYWKREFPQALKDGSLTLQAHDFFTPQPVKNPSVFLLRMVLHDYGRAKAIEILKHLRDAAISGTRLLIVDQIVPYACQNGSTEEERQDIMWVKEPVAPKPLLPNLGKANSIAYIGDFQMYVGVNGEERTLGSFLDLTSASGWKITEIFTIPGSLHHQLVAVPAH